MIESLYIENFAIIDQVQIDFQSGMTVLTGETGAGKSIIIDAIGQLIGQRSQPSFVKNGADCAFIEGVFSSNKEIDKILLDNNFPIDEHLVISKKINHDGKSAIKINYRNSSQLLLKKIMSQIVDIHSQFETHQLFNESYHLKLLDNFIGNELIDLKKEYLTLYQTYKNLNQKYLSLTKEELTDEQLDFYLAQLKEIEELDLENFDEEEFLKERNNLLNYEKNSQHIKNYKALMDSSKGIMDLFKQSLNELSYLEIDDIKHNYDQLYDLYYTVDGINQDIYDQFSQSYFSEERYNEVQDIFFKLNKLKRKYGQTIDAIIDFKNSLIEKIELFKNRDQMIENINLKLKETENQLIYYAKKISILRKNKALELEKEVKYILNQMYLQQVQFKFDFQINDFNDNGIDNVKIVVSTNSGQPLQPLQKIASGGELSRIMLAIKAVSQNSKDGGTIIFDEADTGVSGKVAESIGHVMKKISKKQQVICITHLAQVACFANNHLFIEKEQMDNTSKVHVRLLNEKESVYELAKMISGKEITQQSIDHAKKLKEISV
ncbi:DNA repair protein RecN [Faecalibacillus intestinalis]|uniref:DNA repair protein RecN n=1 Tax=Faecalibacillus intestinalis TaxID=1982626 RepID=A0AAP2UCA2_9FIRM|nr:DNA repair protein RecN [Faecalibacillus intestinalis]MCB8591286.1 DNA repair protein RecN [Faecalibacillus intestinalis]MCB8611870.1 DNA repair protein RecN [Faecalibacillus intestinalis]MCG4679820.1 DNA repair protein RecN [Faecalibacillus intestinalis]MCG4712749.1 DNA repair protein RecN [Faecalibacillus intestinalis]MCG4753963.1 DNA repair protein RecN [Faecalibacillus intestinalis]